MVIKIDRHLQASLYTYVRCQYIDTQMDRKI